MDLSISVNGVALGVWIRAVAVVQRRASTRATHHSELGSMESCDRLFTLRWKPVQIHHTTTRNDEQRLCCKANPGAIALGRC